MGCPWAKLQEGRSSSKPSSPDVNTNGDEQASKSAWALKTLWWFWTPDSSMHAQQKSNRILCCTSLWWAVQYKVKVSVNGSPSVTETGKVSCVTAESEVTQSDAGTANNQKFCPKKGIDGLSSLTPEAPVLTPTNDRDPGLEFSNVTCEAEGQMCEISKFWEVETDSPSSVPVQTAVTKYLGAFRQWVSAHKLTLIPARPHKFALYMQHLGEESQSKGCNRGGMQCTFVGVSECRVSITDSSSLCKGNLGRLAAYPSKACVKERAGNSWYARSNCGWCKQIRISFRLEAGNSLPIGMFLCSGELLNLRPRDCSVLDDNMRIQITQSKTDQLWQGDKILIARSGSSTCPVTILERYTDRTGMSWEDQQFIFQPIQKTK